MSVHQMGMVKYGNGLYHWTKKKSHLQKLGHYFVKLRKDMHLP